MNKHQDLKCFFRLHKYEVYKEEELKDIRGNVIGKVIINRCTNCGRLKTYNISLINNN